MDLKYFDYSVYDGEIVINGFKEGVECPSELIIPEGVTEIGIEAFTCSDIEVLVLPRTLRTIGEDAFSNCFMLSEVRFAANSLLYRIEDSAFNGSYIKKLGKLPASLFEIGKSAFLGCKELEEVEFESGSALEVIGDDAFAFCNSLMRFDMPKNLYSIGSGAFSFCKSLDAVYIPESVKEMAEGVFYGNRMHNITVSGSREGRDFHENFAGCDTEVVFTKESALKCASNKRVQTKKAPTASPIKREEKKRGTTVSKPVAPLRTAPVYTPPLPRKNERGEEYTPLSMFDTEPCEGGLRIVLRPDSNIPPHTLYNIEELIVPPEVVEIGRGAFICCWTLKRVVGHKNLRMIRDSAFYSCPNLSEVILDSDTVVLGQAFAFCKSLKYMRISSRMYEYCFESAGLERVDFIGEISEIREGMFYNCDRLRDIRIPDGVGTIMRNAFKSSGLQNISFGKGLNRILEGAFMLCHGLRSVSIPDSVMYIEKRAFFMSGLQSVDLGGVGTVEKEAFDGTNIDSLTIPKTLSVIREDSFPFRDIRSITFKGRSREEVQSSLYFGFLTRMGKTIYYN